MTRQFNQHFQCSNCGCSTTAETSFGRWIRSNPKLDSRNGLVVYDVDYIVHRYKTNLDGKEFQLVMFVEVKTRNGVMSDPQYDTLWITDQIVRNRRSNRHAEKRKEAGNAPLKVMSRINKKEVELRHFGLHVLTFDGTGPDDSTTIRWDKTLIDKDRLTQLLAFDIEPDRFGDMMELLRPRHAKKQRPLLDSI